MKSKKHEYRLDERHILAIGANSIAIVSFDRTNALMTRSISSITSARPESPRLHLAFADGTEASFEPIVAEHEIEIAQSILRRLGDIKAQLAAAQRSESAQDDVEYELFTSLMRSLVKAFPAKKEQKRQTQVCGWIACG